MAINNFFQKNTYAKTGMIIGFILGLLNSIGMIFLSDRSTFLLILAFPTILLMGLFNLIFGFCTGFECLNLITQLKWYVIILTPIVNGILGLLMGKILKK